MFGPRGQGGLEGTVVEMVHSKSQVVAVDQVKGHLLHVTLILTNNHYSPLGSAPKLGEKRHSLRICLLLLQALLKENS